MTDTDSKEQKGLIAWMARNSIAANLLMFILVGGGLWTTTHIQKEVFPEYELDIVEVNVDYPGAAPAEVEQGILLPIEEAIRGVQGIKEITSKAREGRGSVNIELVPSTNRMKVFQDIDQAINRIRTFPDDTEKPEVRLDSPIREVMEVVLYGKVDSWTLRKLGEELRDRMLSHEKITQIEFGNIPDYVTHVEIPSHTLRKYNLTLDEVSDIIRTSSRDVPAGSLETKTGEILLRLKGKRQWAEELSKIEIISLKNGASITLGDLAEVTDGFEERGFHSQFNQTLSIELNIFRIGNQSPDDIAAAVKKIMTEAEASLPIGVKWRIDCNEAKDYQDRLSLLLDNGLMAVVIVLIILSIFLDIRLAFWVMSGMVISFIGGLIFLPAIGVSINMVSMFAFLVVLGIVVDDAIVVGENIYEHLLQGKSRLRAAIDGTHEVSKPVIFGILTTMIAFVPLLFMPGTTGKFWWPLPAVVIIVLFVSLIEALFILPAHLAHSSKRRSNFIARTLHHWQQAFSKFFDRMVDQYFRKVLDVSLKYRYVTILSSIAIFVLVGGYGLSGHMGVVNMPEVSADEIEAGIKLPVGTTPEQAARVANEVTESTQRMFEKYDLGKVAQGIKTNVRRGTFIDVEIVMRPPEERDMTAAEVISLWRDEIGDIKGISQVTFEAESGPGGFRQDISVDISHSDIEIIEKATLALVERIGQYENTLDISDNYDKGKAQLDFKLLPEGRILGLTSDYIGKQLRDSFYGALAIRQLRGTNEVETRVKLPVEERRDLYHLENLIIQTPAGVEVPLMDVVEFEKSEAFTSINRRDGRRIVTVGMDVEPARALSQVLDTLEYVELPKLMEDFPGLTWKFKGSQEEMRNSTQSLWGGFALAMLIIYGLLAVAFNSYIQPLLVLCAVPFGIIGAVIGHIILGFDLSLISFMGVIALSGVVVNDSLIMIDYTNRKRKEMSAYRAVHQAGLRRFRPIMLTTITTFAGLVPIIFEKSIQAQYLIPMAISLGFGILFATGIILLLVPSLYMLSEDIKKVFR